MRLLLERGARGLALLAAALVAAVPAGAGERLEIAGYAGYTFPFYSQTFRYDPGQVTVPIPGVSVEQSGQFEAKASGGPAFAGGDHALRHRRAWASSSATTARTSRWTRAARATPCAWGCRRRSTRW